MGRRKIYTSPFDRITEDGILCLIISYLTLKEAVRCSILSRRWRHIWTRLPNLNIDGANMLHADNFQTTSIETYAAQFRDKFITSVDSLLNHHQGIGVNTFQLRYALHKNHSCHLHAWVDFVVASRTKAVHFALGPYDQWDNDVYGIQPQLCEFPCHLLGSSSIEKLVLVSCSLKLPHGFDGLSYLKSLQLHHVDVTEDDIRLLLSNSFTLQSLEVEGSQKLVKLSVSHTVNRLTHLYVQDCNELKKIDIDAINLANLSYRGFPVEFIFKESLLLTKANIYFESSHLDHAFNILSNNLPRLEHLMFEIQDVTEEFVGLSRNLNRFNYLRHLEWVVSSLLRNSRSHHCLTFLLNAAPFLEELSLKSYWGYQGDSVGQIKNMKPPLHDHLKRVNFRGFYGDNWQVMLLVHVLRSATKLESIKLWKADGPWKAKLRYRNMFEKNVEHLREQVPTNVKFVVV